MAKKIEESQLPELFSVKLKKVKSNGDFIVEEIDLECKANSVNEAIRGMNELLKLANKN